MPTQHTDEPQPKPHRWSGWPGAWCLDCGAEDLHEVCVGCDPDCVCYPGSEEPCRVEQPPCPTPGAGLFDPYRKEQDGY